jgi:hypothetical protein
MLKRYYSLHECNDIESLMTEIKTLSDIGKIEYSFLDKWTFSISDIDLSESEEINLVYLFDKLEVYPEVGEYENDDDDYPYEDWDEDDY